MQVKTGTYVGNAADVRPIYVGFQPDVVIVDMDEAVDVAPNEAVIRTSTMVGDASKALDGAIAIAADKIQSLDPTGFTLGTHATVNETGRTYHWVAFQAGSGKLKVGSYGGNGVTDDRSILGVGFQPEYVIVMPESADRSVHRSSAMPGDLTHNFEAQGFADAIQALETDGFQVGLDPHVNAAGVTYHYAAWNAAPGEVAVGVYTGDGITDPRSITGVGFFPEYVIVNRSLGVPGDGLNAPTHKMASSGVTIDRSLLFDARIGEADNIQALQSDGFQVGLHNRVNSNAGATTYYWMAFGPHAPQTNYRSIGIAPDVLGTLTATQQSVVVTDPTASWQSANRGRGDRINIGGTEYTVLAVDSETQLRLTQPFANASGLYAYTISRQFGTLQLWEDCVDGPGGTACTYFPVTSNSLVVNDRREVGIAYEGSVFALTADVSIQGSVTDPTHTITLTADGSNRHNGTTGMGVVLDGQGLGIELLVRDSNVTVEWLEFIRFRGAANEASVRVLGSPGDLPGNVLIQNVLIHDFLDALNDVSGIRLSGDTGKSVTVRNCMIWDGDKYGIEGDDVGDTLAIENCSIDNMMGNGSGIHAKDGPVTVRNTIVTNSSNPNYVVGLGSLSGSNNISSDGTAPGANPLTATALSMFFTPNVDLHLKSDPNVAVNSALDLSASFWNDIDGQSRWGLAWDRGADERDATTAVELVSFTATGKDRSAVLEWETASELENLGFHLYRAESEAGAYTRITSRPIPGLGSSPAGARYNHLDSGLVNGVTYFYKLEDVETTGKTALHGPVFATASADASPPEPVRSSLIMYGNPDANGFRVLRQSSRGLVLELITEGFTAEPQEDGSVRLSIPGFEPLQGSPSVPVLRPWVEALSGRGVAIASVESASVESFTGLRPSGADALEIVASREGTVRAGRRPRRAYLQTPGWVPNTVARLLQVGFQGDVKKAQIELAPLRWNGGPGELVLARRVTVELAFRGAVAEKQERRRRDRNVLFRLVTVERGLYELKYEDLFSRGRGLAADRLRLSRLGEPVALHVEPAGRRFGRGSTLYFLSEGPDANPYGREAVYELETGGGGVLMNVDSAQPHGEERSWYLETDDYEENRFYQAGLLDAPDLWLWDVLLGPVVKSFPFQVKDLRAGPSRLTVWLQGVSDFSADPDHHIKLYVNGAIQEELYWNGKQSQKADVHLMPGVLREGENRLEIENAGDTEAPYSMVMLDRFRVVYPRAAVADRGTIEGLWPLSGTASIDGLSSSLLLDVTGEAPRWLSSAEVTPAGDLRFRVESGRTYIASSREAVRRPLIRNAGRSKLKNDTLGADYLVIGPREFATAAAGLLEHRRAQGLRAKFAAVEDVYGEFGFGEARPEAIRDFLSYAYHHWQEPRVRYVLLLGDATYDFKDYLGTGVTNRLPPLMVKTSYLWTVSDPTLAAIHGDDVLPDVAIGRLPARDAEELRVMVAKILAYETGEAGVESLLVLVNDNSDRAADFAGDADEIAQGVLSGRPIRRLSVAELGGSTRGEILRAFDEGASLVSYIGHGGIHLWADENVLNVSDAASLSPQPQQPLLVTMNCLNGYFHFPYFDSLAEALLKSEGKGAIAAFSPSGLSLNEPAHRFHQALLDAVFDQNHSRLGDAVLAAQRAYAESGAFPELLMIYHLLGDPALQLR